MCAGVKVAVDNAAFKFDRLYSYRVPESLREFAVKGARVLVPFGKGAPRMGVVLEYDDGDGSDLKEIIDAERDRPALSPELVSVVLMLRETSFCTYYDAVRTVLPKSSRLVSDAGTAIKPAFSGHMETVYEACELPVPPRLTEKQRAALDALGGGALSAGQLRERAGVSRDVLTRLCQKGIIREIRRAKEPGQDGAGGEIPELSQAQQSAFSEICRCIDDGGKPDTTLLYGVTASGKTHVYTKLIERTLESGRGVLILVPEIALATQTIERLVAMFGDRVGVIHSALSDSERGIQWESIRSGEKTVAVGARSAVFSPVKNLGLIIIDEEQENSYISEQNPRYDARAVAAFRAKKNGAHLVLASATPSVESFWRAKTGAYNLVKLGERYRNAPLPSVKIADMRKELLAGNSHYVSLYLVSEIKKRIERGEQCILLLNRRGYRTVSICSSCGAIVKCNSCDSPLVVHRETASHVCHYCGRREPIAEVCRECGGKIRHMGIGTQKMEEELEALLPEARILRLDLDAVGRKNSAERYIKDFSEGRYDIIVGTQMIAKGLDFKNVTLVGVLSVDQMLLMPSYRANERTFSMLTQVIGRSGRGERSGEAIIQTVDPDNTIIRLAAKQDYEGFFESEIRSRRAHLYPPFCAMSTVGFLAPSDSEASEAAAEFSRLLVLRAKRQSDLPLRVLGPAPMRVAYVKDVFRYSLVLKSRGDRAFRRFLRECADEWSQNNKNNRVKLFVDLSGDADN